MAFDKDIPASDTSLRASNPQILENQESTQEAVNNEHIFAGTSAGTQTGDHTQGSARCFSQASAPATRIDGAGFLSTDLGSLWIDTDDNAMYILTATAPTWTPVSTEVIATLLAQINTWAEIQTFDKTLTVATGTVNSTAVFSSTDSNAIISLSDNATTGGSEAILDRNGNILTLNPVSGDTILGTATGSADRSVADKAFVEAQIAASADPAYTGGESHTFDGGLIMKSGTIARSGNTTTVTFASAFLTAIVSAQISVRHGNDVVADTPIIRTKNATTLTIYTTVTWDNFEWFAIGY